MVAFEFIYPNLRVRALQVYSDMLKVHRMVMRPCQGLRSYKMQLDLYEQGRKHLGPIVTNAKPGQSAHNFGCGVDSCFVGEDPFLERSNNSATLWSAFGKYCKAYGLVWGGDFKHFPDKPHAELTYGLSLQTLQEFYHAGGIPAVWAKFDQIRGVPEGSEWKDISDKLKLF